MTKSVCLLSLSPIADDPRVRRQGDAFHEAGWEVTAVGVGTSRSSAPPWKIIQADAPVRGEPDQLQSLEATIRVSETLTSEVFETRDALEVETRADVTEDATLPLLQRLRTIGRKALPSFLIGPLKPPAKLMFQALSHVRVFLHFARWQIQRSQTFARYLLSQCRAIRKLLLYFIRKPEIRIPNLTTVTNQAPIELPPAIDPDVAEAAYLNVFEINRMYEAAKGIKSDVYLANDWHMLPVARRLARENGSHYGYDTHEYAVEEYRYRPDFLANTVPMVRAIEARGLEEALVTTAVSAGIAADMAKLHQVSRVPVEIRNVPDRTIVQSRQCGRRIRVYFHGIITFDRGLEECIRSIPMWRPEFVFQMRGPIREEFYSTLQATIIEAQVWSRVEILPEVPMLELVASAAQADIGISTPPSTSKHNIYALPNKFFEYIQAGLAICVADLPDMRAVVDKYDLGVFINKVTPESIAQAVNTFTPELVDHYKANALVAASELNWTCESRRLIQLYETKLAESKYKSIAPLVTDQVAP